MSDHDPKTMTHRFESLLQVSIILETTEVTVFVFIEETCITYNSSLK